MGKHINYLKSDNFKSKIKILVEDLNKRKTTGQNIIAVDGTYNNTNINRDGTLEKF